LHENGRRQTGYYAETRSIFPLIIGLGRVKRSRREAAGGGLAKSIVCGRSSSHPSTVAVSPGLADFVSACGSALERVAPLTTVLCSEAQAPSWLAVGRRELGLRSPRASFVTEPVTLPSAPQRAPPKGQPPRAVPGELLTLRPFVVVVKKVSPVRPAFHKTVRDHG